ncbi:MAG: TspO/MBR family protein [Rhodospirillales bacterium]
MQTRPRRYSILAAFLAACLAVSAAGGAVTQTSVNDWYQTLDKPALTPPDWLFAPTWIALYVMMAVAAWRVWLGATGRERRHAMTVFAVQLLLNFAWSLLFFGARAPGWAMIELAVLWLAIALTTVLFWGIERFAGLLLVPYLLWVTFAGYLNASIFLLN